MTTSKLIDVEFKKKLNFGDVYLVKFENGDEGEAIEKTEPRIGDEWQYTIEETQYGNKIKRVKEQGKFAGGKGGYQREAFEEKAVGFAFSYAKDLTVAGKLEPGKKMIETANAIYDAMLATAKRGRV